MNCRDESGKFPFPVRRSLCSAGYRNSNRRYTEQHGMSDCSRIGCVYALRERSSPTLPTAVRRLPTYWETRIRTYSESPVFRTVSH